MVNAAGTTGGVEAALSEHQTVMNEFSTVRAAPAAWRVELFGGVRVTRGDTVIDQFRTQKTAVLLAYTACHRSQSHRRDELAKRLWPDATAKSASLSLGAALSTLESQLLGEDGPGPLLLVDRTSVRVNEAIVSTDVAEFETAFARSLSAETGDVRRRFLAHAVDLYRAELLPGFPDEWILAERRRLASLYFQALLGLTDESEREGELLQALDYAWRAVRAEPLQEGAHQRLIRILVRLGQPSAACQHLRAYEELLRTERGDAPSETMQQLSRELEEQVRVGTPMELPAVIVDPSRGSVLQDASESPIRVVLLAGSPSPGVAALVGVVEREILLRGYSVTTDLHLKAGLTDAERLLEEIGRADLVVPILTPTSAESEALQYGLQVAFERSQADGAPRVVSLQTGDMGAIPEPVAFILRTLNAESVCLGEDPAEAAARLLSTAQNPPIPLPEARSLMTVPQLEAPGAAVPLDSPFYIPRPADVRFHEALKQRHTVILIRGARQTGKSSLLARGLQQARAWGARVVWTDFQKLSTADCQAPAGVYRALAESIAEPLGLEASIDQVWESSRSPGRNFERYFRKEVLGPSTRPLVWAMDGVDRLFVAPFAGEVFALFRSWYNELALNPNGPWKSLTMVITYATEIHLFISDLNLSPFNVGTVIPAAQFSPEEVAELNARYDHPLKEQRDLDRLYTLTGGHPHLCRLALNMVSSLAISLQEAEAQALSEDGALGDHLRRLFLMIAREPALCQALKEVLERRPCSSPEAFYRLRSAGILVGGSAGAAQPACRLYADYLRENLL